MFLVAAGPCNFTVNETVCGCLQGKFNSLGRLINAGCTGCWHPFKSHDTSAANLGLYEVPSVSDDDRSITKRARLDIDAILPVPNTKIPAPNSFLRRHHLGSNVYKTAGNGSSITTHLPQLNQSWITFSQCSGVIFVDKTNFIELLDREGDYQHIVLRPRRFGKSTFLSTLCRYYDIAEAAIFPHVFGDLYIGKNPTTSRNKHLVLKFDLSTIDISGDVRHTTVAFNRRINNVLISFLEKYRDWIGLSRNAVEIICEDDASTSLYRTLALVKKSGCTLFVGIDEYDAPMTNAMFDGSGRTTLETLPWKAGAIESIFDDSLFSVLREACEDGYTGCISKYFLTGVLPAFRGWTSPLAAITVISGYPEFHGICGLTTEQTKIVTEAYLGTTTDRPLNDVCSTLQKYYNGYYFVNGSENELDRLYDPQLVFRYLSALKAGEQIFELEDSRASHTTDILRSATATGESLMEDIVRLVATGFLKTNILAEFGLANLMAKARIDRSATFTLLVNLGVLTHDVRPDIVRIPNELMKTTFLKRIRQYINAQEPFLAKLGPANWSLQQGSIDLFIELLEKFVEHRLVRTLFMHDEIVFRAVVEMLLNPLDGHIGEVCLLMDGSKEKGSGRFGFVDMFPASHDGGGVLLEVKDIRLAGLISGKKGKWVPKPLYVEMEQFSEELSNMDKGSLNKLRYMYWSEDKKRVQSTTVGRFMKDALQQLERYVQVMKMGCAAKDSDSGVLDKRLKISPGNGDLHSFVVMGIGGRKILWQSVGTVSTEFSYRWTGYIPM